MWCSACGTENPAAAKFCEECGTSQARACPHCGHEVGPRAKFCAECGQSLPTAATGAAQRTSPQDYTPSHLVDRILASRSALEGERKQVTVLFADLKGSTELIRDLDPEDAQRLLDGALRAMMDAVHRYEGTVNQVMGDGIMALIGAPIAHEDHAVRACYAALAMHDAIRRYADEARRRHGVALQLRAGLNSGEVVVRAIANDLRMDYSAVGATVHLAARMEQLATPGSTLLGPETLRLAEGFVEVRQLGPVPVKGFDEPVDVFELVGAGHARTRLQAAATRGLSHFVGRQAETAAVSAALGRAGGGHGQVVALVGEPGVGKSRIVWEVTHSHRVQGWTILESSSISYGRSTPYLPVIDLLKGYCRIEARDDARAVREKVAGKVLMLDRALESVLPALLALLDLSVEDPAWQVLDPLQRRGRTLDAVKRLLLRECRIQPLLLVFEDLHWIDAETQALLDSLVESLPTARALLLVNYRPEYRHRWGGKTYYTQLRVDPLPPESADELLGSLLGDDSTVAGLRSLLIERTEGNPFFLEEAIRSLVETGALSGERGAYRLTQVVASSQVPPTVQAILAARTDRLEPENKRLLQTAAVIGKDVPLALLGAVAELADEDLQRGLAELREAEFLHEASLFPEPEYTFKHALTHEVAYDSLLHERRRELHGRILDAIEVMAGDRVAEQVERLAQHAMRGELWPKALHYLRQAYARAMANSAQWQAVAYAEQALAALEHLPDAHEKTEQAIDLRFQLRHALWSLGEFGRIREILTEANRLAGPLDDRRRQGWASLYLCTSHYGAAEHDRAVAAGERALTLGAALGDETLHILAHVHLGQAHIGATDYEPGIELLSRAADMLRGDLLRDRLGQSTVPSVLARVNLVRGLAELGRFAEAIAAAAEAVRIAEEVDHPSSLALAWWVSGLPHLRRGDLSQAIPALERSLGICSEFGLPTYRHWIAPSLGSAYTLTGRVTEAVGLLEQTIAHDATVNLLNQHSLSLVYLGEALLLADRELEALQRTTDALHASQARNERGYQAWALRLLGEITSRVDPTGPSPRTSGQPRRAECAYSEALRLAGQLGMRPLVAHCHVGLGKLHERCGRSAPAREHLTLAVRLYRELDMKLWLDQLGGGSGGEVARADEMGGC